MKILIDTEGGFPDTKIYFNGVFQPLLNWSFSIQQPNPPKSFGKPKMQYQTVDKNGKTIFVSLFGDDFKKFAEQGNPNLVMGIEPEEKKN